MKKLQIRTAKSTQPAIPGVTDKDKTLCYLIIGDDDNKVIINVGDKTYEKVTALLSNTKEEKPKP